MDKEIQNRAKFDKIRYANCWEDADILLEALNISESTNCLSIGSAGDNSFSILSRNPNMVVAVDLSNAQISLIELKKAAYQYFNYDDLLSFLGFNQCDNRIQKYNNLKKHLSENCISFWNNNIKSIENGVIHEGKFESYFKIFRKYIIPFIHSKGKIRNLLKKKSKESRIKFYNEKWDTISWNIMFKLFFSKTVMGYLGRDPEFFQYVKTSIADSILARAKYALSILDTNNNPYLNYILTGNFNKALPHFVR